MAAAHVDSPPIEHGRQGAEPSLAGALEEYPRVRLAHTPTPLDPLPRLGSRLGTQVLLKRDDLTGLALGGDKPRKLEYELGRARAEAAEVVVTGGSMQSNHARLTAAAARRLGMDCVVVLSRDSYAQLQGNLLTVHLMGAQVRVVAARDHWDLQPHLLAACDEVRESGRRPYLIPVSGTTPLSCLGYVRAGLELAAQLRDQGVEPDAFYTPCGTGGILAGLLTGLRHEGFTAPVIGISVNQSVSVCEKNLDTWWAAISELTRLDPGRPRGDVEIYDEFIGAEYGDPTAACLDAILLLAQTEGVLLDPVYSGKVAAGLIAHCGQRRWTQDHTVVVLHSGGVPALFAYQDAIREHLTARGVPLDALG
ncbi:MAG: D-cysteine desulfhydrase family protein [Micromonosporaceae bacterium]